ncbi:MAG: YceI family protein [Planctomycetes bacterium]|nr:YceI family protein [Planctomycetota bacterium]
MKHTTYLALPALLLAPWFLGSAAPAETAAAPAPAPAAFQIDPTHSWVLFKVNHLGIGTAWGTFAQFSGSFSLDAEDVAASSVKLSIEAASVNTNNKKRDDHLKGPDFFNSKEFPSIGFSSTKVEGGDGHYTVTGTLELLGKKQQVRVAVDQVGEGNDPWGNYRAGFEGSFTLDRTAFGMDFMKEGLGAEVTVTLAFEGVRQ